ncbi:hypothetical protein [Roseisolibacter sp. H3M3-2]|nr:hypothetical protein [Roseisolibacter sp. H3M3-2]MDF1506186.1 hypothetical protein [Roseisolibacter sp. H3M3-2]
MTQPADAPPEAERVAARARFRATLVRVLAVQAVTLVLLWLVQRRYTV